MSWNPSVHPSVATRSASPHKGGLRHLGRAALRCIAIAVAACFFNEPTALASVPSQLTVNNRGLDFNAVVQLDTATQSFGTGSIVDKFKGGDGNYYVCVLTADHVVSFPLPKNRFKDMGGGGPHRLQQQQRPGWSCARHLSNLRDG
jgi:hypothetical protein